MTRIGFNRLMEFVCLAGGWYSFYMGRREMALLMFIAGKLHGMDADLLTSREKQ